MHATRQINGNSRQAPRKTASGLLIESGLPIPEMVPLWQLSPVAGRGRPALYDLSGLRIGDSVFFKTKNSKDAKRTYINVRNAAKRAGFTLTSRTVEGGTRFWRAA